MISRSFKNQARLSVFALSVSLLAAVPVQAAAPEDPLAATKQASVVCQEILESCRSFENCEVCGDVIAGFIEQLRALDDEDVLRVLGDKFAGMTMGDQARITNKAMREAGLSEAFDISAMPDADDLIETRPVAFENVLRLRDLELVQRIFSAGRREEIVEVLDVKKILESVLDSLFVCAYRFKTQEQLIGILNHLLDTDYFAMTTQLEGESDVRSHLLELIANLPHEEVCVFTLAQYKMDPNAFEPRDEGAAEMEFGLMCGDAAKLLLELTNVPGQTIDTIFGYIPRFMALTAEHAASQNYDFETQRKKVVATVCGIVGIALGMIEPPADFE